jgi:hypothetical protein
MATDYDKILDNIGKIETRQREIRTRQNEIREQRQALGNELNALQDEANVLLKDWSKYRRTPWTCPICKRVLTFGQKTGHMAGHNLAGHDITVQE